MRSALLTSAFFAATLLALGTAPAEAAAEEEAASCQSCAAKSDCPHCKGDAACPKCNKSKTCAHCGKGHPHHGKWGAHQWAYKCVRPKRDPEAMSKQFSGLGERGWRLVEADSGIWCFSRIRKSN